MPLAFSFRDRSFWLLWSFCLALLVGCENTDDANLIPSDKIGACVQAVFDQTKPDKITNPLIHETSLICQARLHHEGLLRDFELRRAKFHSQAYQEGILLWMVVSITITGVGLAGLQLLLAFKLATTGNGRLAESNSLDIERGKLSVKSSVTGLLVLICSFAFFWVFVREIYVVKPIDVDRLSEQSEKKSNTKPGDPFDNRQIETGPITPNSPSDPEAQMKN